MEKNMSLSLEDVRTNAKEKLKGVCMVYRDCDGDPSRFCQGSHYGRPLGIGGIGSGASFHNNWLALRRINIRMKLIEAREEPDTAFDFFGEKLSMPIMAAPVSGVGSFGGEGVITEARFCDAVVLGCKDSGTVGWRGDTYTYDFGVTPGIDAIAKAGGCGVLIVKPRSQDDIIRFFEMAAEAKAMAVGVDIDGCASYMMNTHGKPVFRKSRKELAQLARSTSLPFIVKGIMCMEDALEAAEAGAKAIVVSNHGGRVLDHTPGTADILPGVARALSGGSVMLLADGGIRTGYDALKMLALGAHGVLVGRDIVRAAVGAEREGVKIHMEYMRSTLAKAMLSAGVSSLNQIKPECVMIGRSAERPMPQVL
jgi:isopentenyl diphosphate isomerase/L-lactate dehydrogenase-like FMN-dependent dehydrogenase